MSDDAQTEEPWICFSYSEEHEDALIGNREGFRLLKAKIDVLFETGRVPMTEAGIEWNELKLVADDPRKKKGKPSQFRDAVACVATATFLIVVTGVFGAGIMNIYSWFK